ncbi:thioredoxin family protein [Pedobacter soli]|uniref:Thioredoxin-like n=1 Tax=Pedobacter soli TaxID=390242 RepID=A0A1G6QI92_9SPHI|nr:thioredoxin family protein [Pedobacter soli]SDC92099.1 Thioredoxin-like [Pedobacter soli]
MKKLIHTLCLLLTAIGCLAQNQSLNSVLKQAKKENKLIFVDCYFTGCIPCAQMDENVFPNALVKAEMDKNFLMLKVDIFKDKLGDTLKVQHILNGFPTFLVLNGDGKLISSSSGYKDPGNLIALFADARQKATQHKFLSGFSTSYNEAKYPAFYVEFCKTRKGVTGETIAAYTDTLKNFKAENALLPYLVTRSADEKAIETIFADYNGFVALYGEEVLQPVVDNGLNQKLAKAMKTNSDQAAFDGFLANQKKNFSDKTWKICLQTLGSRYYLAMKKDTVGFLKFSIKNPVLYQYHFNALYSTLLAKKGFNPEVNRLFCQWADAIVTENSGLEYMKTAAAVHRLAKDEAGYSKFVKMAAAYTARYQMKAEPVEISSSK